MCRTTSLRRLAFAVTETNSFDIHGQLGSLKYVGVRVFFVERLQGSQFVIRNVAVSEEHCQWLLANTDAGLGADTLWQALAFMLVPSWTTNTRFVHNVSISQNIVSLRVHCTVTMILCQCTKLYWNNGAGCAMMIMEIVASGHNANCYNNRTKFVKL